MTATKYSRYEYYVLPHLPNAIATSGGCWGVTIGWPSPYDHRSSHTQNAGTEHARFAPTGGGAYLCHAWPLLYSRWLSVCVANLLSTFIVLNACLRQRRTQCYRPAINCGLILVLFCVRGRFVVFRTKLLSSGDNMVFPERSPPQHAVQNGRETKWI